MRHQNILKLRMNKGRTVEIWVHIWILKYLTEKACHSALPGQDGTNIIPVPGPSSSSVMPSEIQKHALDSDYKKADLIHLFG